MRFARARTTPEATFDLTNLIDVVLLLIIFFMLTAQFAKSNQRPMDLPREKGVPETSQADLAVLIELDRDGSVTLGGEKVGPDRLIQVLSADARRMGKGLDALEVTIRADRSCVAAHLNGLMTALGQVGIRKWKLATIGGGGS